MSAAQDVQLLNSAWESYVSKAQVEKNIIRPVVAHSWQRCKLLKVDPYGQGSWEIKGMELREKVQQHQHLIQLARPFMENLYNFVKGSGFQVVLADAHGFLLEVIGDSDILERTRMIHLCPGGNWSERVKGTNAIGTAIVEQRPVQIFAHEHFVQANHFITCSAAPILDPDGQLAGVLDVTGDYRFANPHTLGMVVAAAYAIENQLRLHKATSKLYMAYKYSNTLMESMSDGIISIDNSGIITQINSVGGRILGVDPEESVGRKAMEVFQRPLPMEEVIKTGKGYEDKEIILDRPTGPKHFTSTTKPLLDDQGNIIGVVATLREIKAVRELVSRMAGAQARFTFEDIIGISQPMQEAIGLAKVAADSISTVLIQGESGTGKELFAQAIHNGGSRKEGPFVAINCAAMPRDLIESELFGYDEGAFTGAKKGGRPGKFEMANGGTLFLDEIGDMPLETQVKLLRVLQEKMVVRVGGQKVIPVDIRVIAATHKDLASAVEKGDFRLDLYYRLNVININVPPLRERGEDLSLLTKHLTAKVAARLGKDVTGAAPGFLARVKAYSWPGNVRELENVVERAVNLANSGGLLEEYLPDQIREASILSYGDDPILNEMANLKSLKDLEKEAILKALTHHQRNISRAAATLGIGRNTLYRKLKEYGIEVEEVM
ncbi:MAG: sigma-54-dependent Fis family transcriptional regulator [Clostridia bacterium]|nr:sigma-54-dependent Fis family transcriptional regulator [Clostridia bacterium]